VYSQIVLDHFHNPRNVGPLEGATHKGVAGFPGEGQYVILFLKIEEGIIQKVAYNVNGCPAMVGAASFLTEFLVGQNALDAIKLTAEQLIKKLGGLPEGKEHAALMAIEALNTALKMEVKNGT
jgi:nitrogen fixation NifU-like protein